MEPSEFPPDPNSRPKLPPFPAQYYPPDLLPPCRRYGVVDYVLLLLLVPPVSALGGICGYCLWSGGKSLECVNLAGPAVLGAILGTVNGLFARAHTKLSLLELLLMALVVGAIPQVLMIVYIWFFFNIPLGL